MAKKEKNAVENQGKKKLSKGWKLAIIGFSILVAGVLAFGGASILGFLTLARDLMATAVVLDAVYVGGVMGVSVANAINNRKNAEKSNVKTKTLTESQELNRDEQMEAIPVPSEKNELEDNIQVISANKDNSKKQTR